MRKEGKGENGENLEQDSMNRKRFPNYTSFVC